VAAGNSVVVATPDPSNRATAPGRTRATLGRMPQPQFTEGAIRPPSDYALNQHLAALEQEIAVAKVHRDAFRELGSEFVYARKVRGPHLRDVEGSWVVLVRFGWQSRRCSG
jgi:hypothetical protein